MENWPIYINLGIWAVLLILVIYLIFRRVRISKEETFEKRDN